MNKIKLTALLLLLTGLAACNDEKPTLDTPVPEAYSASINLDSGDYVCARMQTTMGDIDLALDTKNAPLSSKNFMDYANSGFYAGTTFHRVINGFMIQGGGWTTDLNRKETNEPILNEADNGLKNIIGSIALARTMEPHSATSQFFINVNNNTSLDHQAKTTRGWGYAVFGQVVNGMDVVNKIKQVPTEAKGMMPQDVPVDDIVINAVTEVNCASLK